MDREAIGPYRLIRPLGKGGMGAVFEAVHQTIERRAAIKILHPEFASNPEYTERFVNEARAANRIGHPSIVAIYDTGTLSDGTTYLVMEFLDGETLTQRLRSQGGKLPAAEAMWIGFEIAGAVGAAHRKGIIHRDLKPDNIMLIRDADSPRGERVKLLDFGIAKFSIGKTNENAATQVGTVMGTLSYMPPEQLRNTAHVTDRADVYALGALLYQMLSGQPPFVAASDIDLMAMHLRDEAVSIAEAAPETPPKLAHLVGRMLAKDPSLRPAMEEVAKCLFELLRAAGSLSTGEQPSLLLPNLSGVVPETLVRRSPNSAGKLESSPPREPSEKAVVAPSASTLSGSASQASILGTPKRMRRRLGLVIAAGAVPLVLAMVILSSLHRQSVPAPASPPPQAEQPKEPARASTSGATPPTIVTPPPAPGPPIAPNPPPVSHASPPEPSPAQPSETPPVPAPSPARCQRTPVVLSCVVNGQNKLSLPVLDAVVRAAKQVGLKPCAGRKLRAVREGRKMVFEPEHLVDTDLAKSFADTLRGLLPAERELPSEVIFRCGK